MTKDELITKQQLKIEELETLINQHKKTRDDLLMRFYAIGQPLNDNKLQFNKEQLLWCLKTVELIESFDCNDEEEDF